MKRASLTLILNFAQLNRFFTNLIVERKFNLAFLQIPKMRKARSGSSDRSRRSTNPPRRSLRSRSRDRGPEAEVLSRPEGSVHPPPAFATRSGSSGRLQRSSSPARRSLLSSSRGRGHEAEAISRPEGSVHPPPTIKREKRAPATQEVPLSTPGREHVSTRPRVSDYSLMAIKANAPEYMQSAEGEGWWRAIFSTTLPNKHRVSFKTMKEIWVGKQVEVVMRGLRERISIAAKAQGLDVDELRKDLCMVNILPWEKAWLSFENQVNKKLLEKGGFSERASRAHETKAEAKRSKDWSVGTDYSSFSAKSKAKSRLLSELEIVCEKELAKAESVLSAVVSDLKEKEDFNELFVLSDDTQKRLTTIDACFTSAQKNFGKMTKSMNVTSAKILTSVVAVLLPEKCFEEGNDVSQREFYNLLSINRNSKYFDTAIENRKKFNSFLEAKGELSVGELVSCRSSPEAIITAIKDDDTVTVKLLPYGTEKSSSHSLTEISVISSLTWVFTIALHALTPHRHT